MGIKLKYAIILSSLFCTITIVMGVFMVLHQKSSMESQIRSMAGAVTGGFSRNSKFPLLENDSLAMSQLIENILKNPSISSAAILNESLTVKAERDMQAIGERFALAKTIENSLGPYPWVIAEDEGSITYAMPVFFKDTKVGYTVLAFSKAFVSERVRAAVMSLVIITILAIIFVSFLSIPLASGFLAPIFMLLKGTKEIVLGNFDYKIPEERRDEVGELVRSFNHMAAELKKKEVMKGVFNLYVSPDVADEILREPESLDLGGDRRDLTVFFADIRGFTRHARSMSPEQTVDILNKYFSLITEVVFTFGGTVDKFIGDAVMCVFGSPIASPRHLEEAVKAAVAVRDILKRVNALRQERGDIPMRMGLGLDSGPVIVGNMGSRLRMEYTAVGEAVNMASRFSDLAEGGEILIKEGLYPEVKKFAHCEQVESAIIKGVDKPLGLYSIVELKDGWRAEVEGVVEKTIKTLGEEGFLP
ncbi:MAG: adenylate/guanylate cyclase domain-containing protein [Thermodesulfobacteriota bacterium]